MTTEPVVIEITVPAPVADVWQAFRDPALLRRRFGWEYDGLEDEIRTSMFLCTYGLDLATLADLEIRWSAWWNRHFQEYRGLVVVDRSSISNVPPVRQ